MRSVFSLTLTVILTLGALARPAPAAPSKAAPPRSDTAPPLALAAWKADHHRIAALLAAGQDPNGAGMIGLTLWMWSLLAQDKTGFRMLMDSVKDFRPAGGVVTEVFLFQVLADEREIVRELLERGIPVDARTSDGTTPLLIAAASGHAEMIGLLLERGAQVNLGDRQGDTALMAAVRAGSVESIGKLLAAGAEVDQPDKLGNRALTFARRTGRTDVQRLLQRAGARVESVPSTGARRLDPRSAVARSLPLLEKASKEWMETRSCNACHLQPVMLQVNALARAQGFPVDGAMRGLLEASVREGQDPEYVDHLGKGSQDRRGGRGGEHVRRGRPGLRPSPELRQRAGGRPRAAPGRPGLGATAGEDAAAGRIVATRPRPGPHAVWPHLQHRAGRPGAEGLVGTDPGGRPRGRVARARAWLVASVPRDTDGAAFKLLGLRWLDADATTIAQAAAALRRRQLASGAWSQVDGLNPDAHATGLALVALAEGAGTRGSDPGFQRGVAYLVDTQEPDGSWLVHKRSVPVNKYFESGFPHGKFQFSSFMGTAWATMALLYAPAPRRN